MPETTPSSAAEPLVLALKQAEERLARQDQPRLEGVRRAIVQDLERVRAAVAATPVALPEDGMVLRLTVSIGAAQLQAGENPTALLQRADEALYEAKRLGRNRVAWAEQENPAQNAPEIRAACA